MKQFLLIVVIGVVLFALMPSGVQVAVQQGAVIVIVGGILLVGLIASLFQGGKVAGSAGRVGKQLAKGSPEYQDNGIGPEYGGMITSRDMMTPEDWDAYRAQHQGPDALDIIARCLAAQKLIDRWGIDEYRKMCGEPPALPPTMREANQRMPPRKPEQRTARGVRASIQPEYTEDHLPPMMSYDKQHKGPRFQHKGADEIVRTLNRENDLGTQLSRDASQGPYTSGGVTYSKGKKLPPVDYG